MFDLVIDARMTKSGGIGTYLRNLMPYLEASGLKVAKIEEGPRIYSVAEQVKLPFLIPKCKVFWSPHFNVPLLPIRAKRRLVTIHDFYHLAHFKQLTALQKAYAKTVIPRAVKGADRLIVVSEFTKSQLPKFFPDFSGRVDVIVCGPGNKAEPKSSLNIPGKFFLFVGNLKPHKNLELLLRAFQLANIEEHLLIVGKKEGFIRGMDFEKLKIPSRVHFLGEISDPELADLYRRAKALVFPSLYEGWGSPPIEAMQAGCPVIAARAASIPEACGDAALYFDPRSAEELAWILRSFGEERSEYIARGFKRAQMYSWEKCANQHLEIIRQELLRS